jgi:hypothetical protein
MKLLNAADTYIVSQLVARQEKIKGKKEEENGQSARV